MSRHRQLTHIGDTALTDRDWSVDLAKLDIALSALRDAFRGSGTKDFTTLEALLATALARDLTKWGGTTLTGRDVSTDLQVLSDLKKGAQNADAVSAETANALKTISLLQALDQNGALARLLVESAASKNLRSALYEGASQIGQGDTPADGLTQPSSILDALGFPHLFNGSTWDRQRNTQTEITLLASAVRSAFTTSAAQVNHNARGLYLFFDVTAVPGVDTVTLRVDLFSKAFSVSYPIFQGPAISAVTADRYMVYPGIGAPIASLTATGNVALSRDWMIVVLHSGSGNFTYSVHGYYIL